MMKYPLLVFAVALVVGCGERKSSTENIGQDSIPVQKDTIPATKQYFPVISFIKGEIASVDSLPVGIKKYTGGNKSKFTYIKPDEFHRLAAEFTPHELEDSAFFVSNYRENSFIDRANGSSTFMYTSTNASLPVQRIDVITIPGDVYDKVKSVYMQKSYSSGDTVFIKKISWKPQQSFQLITQTTKGAGQPGSEITDIVWDSKEGE